jgi:hypothetical protein
MDTTNTQIHDLSLYVEGLYDVLFLKRKTKYDESSSLFLEMLILVSIMSSIKLCKDDEISCNQIYPLCNVITHVMTLYLENYVRSKRREISNIVWS